MRPAPNSAALLRLSASGRACIALSDRSRKESASCTVTWPSAARRSKSWMEFITALVLLSRLSAPLLAVSSVWLRACWSGVLPHMRGDRCQSWSAREPASTFGRVAVRPSRLRARSLVSIGYHTPPLVCQWLETRREARFRGASSWRANGHVTLCNGTRETIECHNHWRMKYRGACTLQKLCVNVARMHCILHDSEPAPIFRPAPNASPGRASN